ncbi:MAG: respiratory nitrate reductase subunit gamma [Nitrospinae bacterium]|nr:respiratory nitrate reductase subunit gamma [Nitrospinota bacterium]
MTELNILSTIFASLSYMVIALFLLGVARKIYGYAATPSPLKIPTTPAPVSGGGVVIRMAREVILFESLFKGNKWTWLGGILFHVTFAVVLFRHLRYFTEPVPWLVALVAPVGILAGVGLLGAAAYLFVRRLAVDRVAYISSGADYFALILVGSLALTGLAMKFVFRTDVAMVKDFCMGIVTFSPANMPADPIFILHYLLVLTLGAYFPFSKLMHAGGIFFSPTRAQIDNPREARHVNPWADDVRVDKA